MKFLLKALGLIIVVIVVVVLGRTLLVSSKQLDPQPHDPIPLDEDGAVARLAQSTTFNTISHQIPWEFRGSAFTDFHAFLQESFPQAHETLAGEVINDYSLWYTWEGTNPDLPPVVLLGHMDVVPVDTASEQAWTQPPFEGVVADGYIWGRGTLDDKSSVMGILEATETLIVEGFKPARTIYYAFGHDEEVGGNNGAKAMADLMKERDIHAWFTLDEGSAIVDGVVPGLDGPIALISLSEKGYVTLELSVEGEGGHSSQPPPHTSIGILAAAITKLENNPMPARFEGPLYDMLTYAGPEMAFPLRMVMSNMWLFKPIVQGQLEGGNTTRAALRTTTAVTMMDAGTKENVLPIQAKATVNFRILAGDSSEDVIAHVTETIADERVTVTELNPEETSEPGPVSDVEGAAYALVNQAVRNVMPDTPVAPGMTIGATDSKHYHDVADDNFRFMPVVMTSEDLGTIHGTNERIAIDNYLRAIQIWGEILQKAGAA
jgi:carboxypeptidase PM20D1